MLAISLKMWLDKFSLKQNHIVKWYDGIRLSVQRTEERDSFKSVWSKMLQLMRTVYYRPVALPNSNHIEVSRFCWQIMYHTQAQCTHKIWWACEQQCKPHYEQKNNSHCGAHFFLRFLSLSLSLSLYLPVCHFHFHFLCSSVIFPAVAFLFLCVCVCVCARFGRIAAFLIATLALFHLHL